MSREECVKNLIDQYEDCSQFNKKYEEFAAHSGPSLPSPKDFGCEVHRAAFNNMAEWSKEGNILDFEDCAKRVAQTMCELDTWGGQQKNAKPIKEPSLECFCHSVRLCMEGGRGSQ